MVYRHTPVVYMGGEKVRRRVAWLRSAVLASRDVHCPRCAALTPQINSPDAEFSVKVTSSESVAEIIAAATAAAAATRTAPTTAATATS